MALVLSQQLLPQLQQSISQLQQHYYNNFTNKRKFFNNDDDNTANKRINLQDDKFLLNRLYYLYQQQQQQEQHQQQQIQELKLEEKSSCNNNRKRKYNYDEENKENEEYENYLHNKRIHYDVIDNNNNTYGIIKNEIESIQQTMLNKIYSLIQLVNTHIDNSIQIIKEIQTILKSISQPQSLQDFIQLKFTRIAITSPVILQQIDYINCYLSKYSSNYYHVDKIIPY